MPWKTISDDKVRHVWAPEWSDSADREITVAPDYYADNGTPVDGETGDDMVYLRTEIFCEDE